VKQKVLSVLDSAPAALTLVNQTHPEGGSARKPQFAWWCIALMIVSLPWLSTPASATGNGIAGFSGKNGSTCTSCHSNGTAPTVSLTGPTSVASGTTNSYTLTVSGTGNSGLDVAASAGAFTAGTGSKVLNGEIVQSSPSSSHSWTFSWTAPTVTATTTATLFGTAIDSFSGGTGAIQQAITVTAAAPAPTIGVSPASLSFSYQSGGSAPAAQAVAVSSSASALNYTVASSATWLTATPASGTTPGNVSVAVNPTSLAAGTYTGTVTIASASNSPKTITITFTVAAAQLPTLSASPTSLSFTYQIGGSAPLAQLVSLTSGGSALNYTTATSATWLSAPPSGTTPGSVSVSVNPTGLAAGTFTGNVTIASSGASNRSKAVPVTLTVTAASLPALNASPLSLSFRYQTGGAAPAAQNVGLTSSGSALSFTAAASAPWLTATPASSSMPGSLSVAVNPTGLALGTYTGTVMVTASGASNSPLKIAVTLGVTAPSGNPPLNITPGSLSFTCLSGSATPSNQTLSVGGGATASNIAATASGGSWLTVTPATGSTPTTLKVSANPTGLATGTYNGTITITSHGASNTPETVPVKLVVTGAGSGRLRVWPPRAASFEYESGHSDPAPRNIRVLSSGAPLGFTAAAHGGTWLSVSPSGGTTPGTISISVDPTGLASGTYTANVKLAAPGSAALTVPVILRIASGDDEDDEDDNASTNRSAATGNSFVAWPYAYDPAGSNSVAASWIDGTGASSSIPADARQQGLLLSKTSAAANQAQAGVVLRNVEGISLTELGYDIRNGGQCTAKSPRFVIVTSDDVVHKLGCSTGTAQPAPARGWKRLRFDPSSSAQTAPAIAPGTKVKSLYLVLDDGPETGPSMVVLDNININGTFIGKQ
jgi:hypothetical protein